MQHESDGKKSALLGFTHIPTDEQLRAYSRTTPLQKLEWLEAAWQLTSDSLPADRLVVYQKMRRGEI